MNHVELELILVRSKVISTTLVKLLLAGLDIVFEGIQTEPECRAEQDQMAG
jgi:hypothetical protein